MEFPGSRPAENRARVKVWEGVGFNRLSPSHRPLSSWGMPRLPGYSVGMAISPITPTAAPGTTAPLRLVHLCAGNLYGGVETFLETFSRHERAAGLASRFLVGWEGRHAFGLRESGAEVELMGGARLSRPWQVLALRRRIRQSLQRDRPDLVVVHSGWTQWVMGPAATSLGIPVVLWFHNDLPTRSLLHQLARRVRPAGYLANSRFTASSVPGWYGVTPPVVYYPVSSPPPVPAEARDEIRHSLMTPPGATVFLQASRLQRWKGHRHLVNAFQRLRDRSDWVWWIAGGAQRDEEAAYRNSLEEMAAGLGLSDRIRWLGHREDIPALLQASDAYVQVNETPEPFGIVFLEALYAGRPVLTGDAGGIAEIVTDACGKRVRAGEDAATAAVLAQWIDEPEQRLRLGKQGPAVARQFCEPKQQMSAIADQLHAIHRHHRLSV